ncbi:hypothetical protein D3C78_1447000 [compost metagenome]
MFARFQIGHQGVEALDRLRTDRRRFLRLVTRFLLALQGHAQALDLGLQVGQCLQAKLCACESLTRFLGFFALSSSGLARRLDGFGVLFLLAIAFTLDRNDHCSLSLGLSLAFVQLAL